MNLKEFQVWLNNHGAKSTHPARLGGPILVDGLKGPETRSAIFQVFTNLSAPAVTEDQLLGFARRLGGSLNRVKAISIVESNGSGYNDQGQPKALYERHYFWKRFKIKIPLLSDPAPGGYTIDADKDGLNDSWEKLADAAMLGNPIKAFECASFGKFQVMGAWAAKLGYENSIEFAWSMVKSEAAHYEALVRYIEVFGGVEKFRAINGNPVACRPFAEFYNGPKQKGYDVRIAAEMRRLSAAD